MEKISDKERPVYSVSDTPESRRRTPGKSSGGKAVYAAGSASAEAATADISRRQSERRQGIPQAPQTPTVPEAERAQRIRAEYTEREARTVQNAVPQYVFCRRTDIFVITAFFCCVFLLAALAAASPAAMAKVQNLGAAADAVRELLASDAGAAEFFGLSGDSVPAGSDYIAAPENGEAVNAEPGEGNAAFLPVYIAYASAEEYMVSPPEEESRLCGVMPVQGGSVNSGFSWRENPLWNRLDEDSRYEFHGGIDIPVPGGTEIVAFADGVVSDSGYDAGYGNWLEIDHGGGYTSFYAHLSGVLAEAGEAVSKGEPVCLSGSSGRVTGAHLHFELRYAGEQTDPLPYIE